MRSADFTRWNCGRRGRKWRRVGRRKRTDGMKCRTKFCRGISRKNGHSPFCAKCRTRRFKEAHPLKYSFNLLRNRARHRGHEFALTFEQYEKFAQDTSYDKLKGKHKYSLSIHRKDGGRGYCFDNIEAVTLSENSRIEWVNMPAGFKAEIMEALRASRSKKATV